MRGSHLDGRRRRHRRTSRFRRPAAVLAAGRADLAQLPWSGASRCPGTHNFVQVTKASAELVMRMSACPVDLPSRRVVIRTDNRKRIARQRVQGTCKHNIARWRLDAEPKNKVIKGGTVIHSYWSGVADNANAPSVKVGKK